MARIVNLVRQRDAKDIPFRLLQVVEIRLFPFLPVRLALSLARVRKTVGARFYDPRHSLAKPVADIL